MMSFQILYIYAYAVRYFLRRQLLLPFIEIRRDEDVAVHGAADGKNTNQDPEQSHNAQRGL